MSRLAASPRQLPLIFTGESVRRILAGEKTQTRRVVPGGPGARPRWRVGDLLWVREVWRHAAETSIGPSGGSVYYRADEEWNLGAGWQTPLFMPRWASRLLLRVVEVRCERLQSISDADAVEEGFRHVSVLTPSEQFAAAWDLIPRKAPVRWASDPLVWVIVFEKVSTAGGQL